MQYAEFLPADKGSLNKPFSFRLAFLKLWVGIYQWVETWFLVGHETDKLITDKEIVFSLGN